MYYFDEQKISRYFTFDKTIHPEKNSLMTSLDGNWEEKEHTVRVHEKHVGKKKNGLRELCIVAIRECSWETRCFSHSLYKR